MSGNFIENPRRAPRAPVRCEARVALCDGGYFVGSTRDVGPGGCQLPTPAPLTPGARVFVELSSTLTPAPFHLSGRVAWAKGGSAGIAFDEASAAPAATLFEQVAADAAAAAAAEASSAPERIATDAGLAPAMPPVPTPALTQVEVIVLTALGDGMTAGELRAQFGAHWSSAAVAVFSLLARGLLVVGPPAPEAAHAWKARWDSRAATGS